MFDTGPGPVRGHSSVCMNDEKNPKIPRTNDDILRATWKYLKAKWYLISAAWASFPHSACSCSGLGITDKEREVLTFSLLGWVPQCILADAPEVSSHEASLPEASCWGQLGWLSWVEQHVLCPLRLEGHLVSFVKLLEYLKRIGRAVIQPDYILTATTPINLSSCLFNSH